MRTLATVQTIKGLEKIAGKDRILHASFENVGFKVIVSSDIQVGDKVVYFEVDSLLPEKEEFEFLRSRCFNKKFNGFRIKNMKMGEVYSEGLAIPLKNFPKLLGLKDGVDLIDHFGVRKYDSEELEQPSTVKKPKSWFKKMLYKYIFSSKLYKLLAPKDKYVWPVWASKSDETRAQNLNYIFEKYQGKKMVSTEKLDGSSCLYGWYKKRFYVCSRNICLKKDPTNNFWKYAIDHNLEKKFKEMRKQLGFDFYLQGELIGPKIQSNKYQLTSLDYYVFNFRNINTGKYQTAHSSWMMEFLGLKTVSVLGYFDFCFKDMSGLLKYADAMSLLNPSVPREGVVIRSVEPEEPDEKQSNMLSFKVINPSFEVKYS